MEIKKTPEFLESLALFTLFVECARKIDESILEDDYVKRIGSLFYIIKSNFADETMIAKYDPVGTINGNLKFINEYLELLVEKYKAKTKISMAALRQYYIENKELVDERYRKVLS